MPGVFWGSLGDLLSIYVVLYGNNVDGDIASSCDQVQKVLHSVEYPSNMRLLLHCFFLNSAQRSLSVH